MPVVAYIGIGSNLGDSRELIRKAVALLVEKVSAVRTSSLYRTEPVGYEQQEDFLNAVVQIETELAPEDLLVVCRSIEKQLGRRRSVRWGPRTIDLDVLLYGDRVIDTAVLSLPHPRMAERKFVLAPLAEIAPDAVHPLLHRTAAQLLADLQDPHRVVKCGVLDQTP